MLTDRLIAKLAQEVEDSGAAFIITGMPKTFARFEKEGIDLSPYHWVNLQALRKVDRSEIQFKNDSHFRPKGHVLLTDELMPVVLDVLGTTDSLSSTSRD
jgi:hypothetical protein